MLRPMDEEDGVMPPFATKGHGFPNDRMKRILSLACEELFSSGKEVPPVFRDIRFLMKKNPKGFIFALLFLTVLVMINEESMRLTKSKMDPSMHDVAMYLRDETKPLTKTQPFAYDNDNKNIPGRSIV